MALYPHTQSNYGQLTTTTDFELLFADACYPEGYSPLNSIDLNN